MKKATRLDRKMDVLALEQNSAKIKSILNSSNKFKIYMANISENVIYSLSIRLVYVYQEQVKSDTFNYSGLRPDNVIVLVPKICDQSIEIQNMTIKFLSASGEIGFCQYKRNGLIEQVFEHPKYYFVRAHNKYVLGNELGEMINT